MIVVNINRSGGSAAREEPVRAAAVGKWVVSEASLRGYADSLVAVRQNVVVGAWQITGHRVVPTGEEGEGKIVFEVRSAPNLQSLVGEPSPVLWTRGRANPVALVDSATMLQTAAPVDLTPRGDRKVKLDGWTLIVYPDGRARLYPEDGNKIVLEGMYPGPVGPNVTVRLES